MQIGKKILFIYRHPSSFILMDMELLRRNNELTTIRLSLRKPSLELVSNFVKLFSRLPKVDVIFIWFAGVQAFIALPLAKVFKKKLVVVAGGYDAAGEKEIGYGAFTNWWRSIIARLVFNAADTVVAVSRFTAKELAKRTSPKRVIVAYNCIDSKEFRPRGKKQNLVLTVGEITDGNLIRKGLISFAKAAKELPDTPFVIVGKIAVDRGKAMELKELAHNLKITGYISKEKLLEYYQNAKVYAQLSYYESFGVSLAEAMACGCIPVVAKRAALPEVAGDIGYYVNYDDVKEIVKAVRQALEDGPDVGRKARKRIQDEFSLEKRRIALNTAVGN